MPDAGELVTIFDGAGPAADATKDQSREEVPRPPVLMQGHRGEAGFAFLHSSPQIIDMIRRLSTVAVT